VTFDADFNHRSSLRRRLKLFYEDRFLPIADAAAVGIRDRLCFKQRIPKSVDAADIRLHSPSRTTMPPLARAKAGPQFRTDPIIFSRDHYVHIARALTSPHPTASNEHPGKALVRCPNFPAGRFTCYLSDMAKRYGCRLLRRNATRSVSIPLGQWSFALIHLSRCKSGIPALPK
jgi:hypothetical protein